MERVRGIEPPLSAWESHRSGPLTALTWASVAPLVTVMDPETPGLMARQWPGYQLWQLLPKSSCSQGNRLRTERVEKWRPAGEPFALDLPLHGAGRPSVEDAAQAIDCCTG